LGTVFSRYSGHTLFFFFLFFIRNIERKRLKRKGVSRKLRLEIYLSAWVKIMKVTQVGRGYIYVYVSRGWLEERGTKETSESKSTQHPYMPVVV